MGKCLRCKIQVNDDTEICPLCRSVLEKGDLSVSVYPNIVKRRRKLLLASRIYLFSAILVEALCIYLNYTLYPAVKWSVIPGCVFACVYLTLNYFLYGKRFSYGMDIILGVAALIAIIDVSDKLLGDQRWSVNFVQPGIFMAVNVYLFVMILLNKRGWQSYITAEIVMVIISLIAIPLIVQGQITHPLVSVIAILLSIVCFVGTLILGGSRSKEELYRKFHF